MASESYAVSLWKSIDSSSEKSRVSLSELAVFWSDGATEMRFEIEGLVRGAWARGGLEVKIGVPGGRSMSKVEDLDTGDSGERLAGNMMVPGTFWLDTPITGSVKYRWRPVLRKELKERFNLCPLGGGLITGDDAKSR